MQTLPKTGSAGASHQSLRVVLPPAVSSHAEVNVGKPVGGGRWMHCLSSPIESAKRLYARAMARDDVSSKVRVSVGVLSHKLTNMVRFCKPKVDCLIGTFDLGRFDIIKDLKANFMLERTHDLSQLFLSNPEFQDGSGKLHASVTDIICKSVNELRSSYSIFTPWRRDIDRVGDDLYYRCVHYGFNPTKMDHPSNKPFKKYAADLVKEFLDSVSDGKSIVEAETRFNSRFTDLFRNEDGTVDEGLRVQAGNLLSELKGYHSRLASDPLLNNNQAFQDMVAGLTDRIADIMKTERFFPYLIVRRTMEATLAHGINFRMDLNKLDSAGAKQLKADLVKRGLIKANWEFTGLAPLLKLGGSNSEFAITVSEGLQKLVGDLKAKLGE